MYTTKSFNDIQPKTFSIFSNGKRQDVSNPMTASYFFTAAQAGQMLDQMQEELSIAGGDYNWRLFDLGWNLKTNRKEYEFRACWHGQSWVEGRGKSPKEALLNSFTFCRTAYAMGMIKNRPISTGNGACVFEG